MPLGSDEAELPPRVRMSRSPHSWGRSGWSSALKDRSGRDHISNLPSSLLLALSLGVGIIDT
jgi:hypothetical protein